MLILLSAPFFNIYLYVRQAWYKVCWEVWCLRTHSFLSFESYLLNFESNLLITGAAAKWWFGRRWEMEDTQTDICHVLASLGFICGNVMPQVVALISSFSNEAAERGQQAMRKTRGRETEKRRSPYTHCVIY